MLYEAFIPKLTTLLDNKLGPAQIISLELERILVVLDRLLLLLQANNGKVTKAPRRMEDGHLQKVLS